MPHLESNEASEANPMIPASRPPSRADTLAHELHSLLGPVPLPLQPPPLARHPTPPLARRRRFYIRPEDRGCWLFGIILNIVYVGLLAGFAYVLAYPLPRSFINRTLGRWIGYVVFVAIFALAVGFYNGAVVMIKHEDTTGSRGRIKPHGTVHEIIGICKMCVIFGLCVFIIFPLSTAVQLLAYSHACDGSWLEVELHGRNYSHRTSPDLAHFSVAATKEPLFTFSTAVNSSTFALDGLVSPNASWIPSLDRIRFDYTTNLINATCYNDTSFGGSCGVEGYVWPYDGLEFGLTYTMPDGTRTTSLSRSIYDYWSFADLPYIILREFASVSNEELSAELLSTSILNRRDCSLMKICVSAGTRRTHGVVGPDVLMPIGWILEKFGHNSIKCTAPGNNH